MGISYNASLGFITLISMERYLAICKPLPARLIATVWFLGLAVTLIYVSGFELQKTCFLWPEEEAFHNLPVIIQLCASSFALPRQVVNLLVFLLLLVINAKLSCKIISLEETKNKTPRKTPGIDLGKNSSHSNLSLE